MATIAVIYILRKKIQSVYVELLSIMNLFSTPQKNISEPFPKIDCFN